jgi:hypothetical protein
MYSARPTPMWTTTTEDSKKHCPAGRALVPRRRPIDVSSFLGCRIRGWGRAEFRGTHATSSGSQSSSSRGEAWSDGDRSSFSFARTHRPGRSKLVAGCCLQFDLHVRMDGTVSRAPRVSIHGNPAWAIEYIIPEDRSGRIIFHRILKRAEGKLIMAQEYYLT